MMFGISRSMQIGASALAIALSLAAAAQAQERAYSRPAEPLSARLREFARVSGEQIVFTDDLVRGKTAPALQGSFSPDEALDRILAGTGLVARRSESGTLMIVRADAPQDPAALNGGATQVDEVVVTGTRIRGASTASPVIRIDAERIAEEGFNDLGDVIRSIPQNFGGGQNPGVSVGATAGAGGIANRNVTGGSSLNLRGLGADATLTLLNGRRLSYGGLFQSVDISAIPVEAVERIEIVADGASAIYGSDAVGGVGNVVLKRDYEGLMVSGRYGGATDGGLTTTEFTATGGLQWPGGGVIATYKDAAVEPIYARQREYAAYMFDPTSLYPGSDLSSALVSLHQAIGSAVEFRLDVLRTERAQELYPYNTSTLPYYNRESPETETLLIAPSLDIELKGDWTLTFGGAWGRNETVQNTDRVTIASGVASVLYHECYCNTSRSYEVSAEGPVFQLPGGDARLAVGAGGRENEMAYHSYITNTDVVRGEESTQFAYGELNAPFIGPEQGVGGIRRFTATAALRMEDYDSFGSVTTPKLGLIYDPNADFTFKASWGRSFKAPTLLQRAQAQTGGYYPITRFGGVGYDANTVILGIFGGNPDLGPERATTRALSLAFHPRAIRGLDAELTWFDVDYRDRALQPITDYNTALQNPNYAPFFNLSPTSEQLAAAVASASAVYNYLGRPVDPSEVKAIMYARYINAARQRIEGLDLSASYGFELAAGHMTLRGSASWLDSEQQNSIVAPSYDIAGTAYNPAKLNARMGAVWTRDGFSAAGFVNFTDGVASNVTKVETDSFTTIDVTLRYATGERDDALSGLEFSLSAENLLDEAPPYYAVTQVDAPPYDSTNYSPIGRYLSVSVAKRW